MDREQDAEVIKAEDNEEAREERNLGLEQRWRERMSGIQGGMFQEGPLFQVLLPGTSQCSGSVPNVVCLCRPHGHRPAEGRVAAWAWCMKVTD